jgi:DNA mismatch repair protein MutL
MTPRPVRVLPDSLVGRIAAGEVIERPASVVKELLENSLDAGATRVDVEVEGGATGLIRVADDASGILPEDLPLAVQRHATSKIGAPEDLDGIVSLGFRGEGLASIAAVSRVRIATRVESEEMAATVVVDEGRIGVVTPDARTVGTTVEVRDLFFNTPARRKYLKTAPTEIRAITQLIQAYALGFPEVGFSFTHEGRPSLKFSPAEDLHARAVQILGRPRVARMIPVLVEEPGLGLEGFLGAPEDSRTRVTQQVFLLNGRWISSPVLRQTVRQAYTDLIPPDRHPEAFLHLRLPPHEVDVNVHPTKREVRLQRERELYPRLIHLLRDRVEERYPALKLRESQRESGEPVGIPADRAAFAALTGLQAKLDLFGAAPEPSTGEGRVAEPPPGDEPGSPPQVLAFPVSYAQRGIGEAAAETDTTTGDSEPALANLWQLHDTYILARIPTGVLIIDQHAAHERVLFEQAMRRLQGDGPVSQELLFPIVVDFAPDEYAVLLEVHGALEKLGFHLEAFGGTSVLVHAIPAGVREWKHGALLRDVVDHYSELPGKLEVHERVARSLACHGAVKAGQRLSLREMNELVDQLFATRKPQGDPHGRPVFLRMDLSELHRRFGRSG